MCGFKRELSFDQTLQLWEVLWTDYLSHNFHLFVALAIIEAHRDVIIRYLREFDEVLKYITQLSQTLDIEAIMADAEVLFATFRQVVESCDRRAVGQTASTPVSSAGLRRRGGGAAAAEGEDKQAASASAYPPAGSSGQEASHEREVVVQTTLPEIDDELRRLLL